MVPCRPTFEGFAPGLIFKHDYYNTGVTRQCGDTIYFQKCEVFWVKTKAIYIRLADMVYPDGNTIKASAGLCHYANYERLRDKSRKLS